jgi:hypothetical protein
MAGKTEHSKLVNIVVKLSKTQPFFGRCEIVRNETGTSKRSGKYIPYGHPGWADVIGIAFDGRFCAAEIKVGPDKLSEKQIDFRETIQKYGGYWAEVRDIDSAMRFLQLISGYV